MARNNFQQLEEEENKTYPGVPSGIKSSIQSEVGVLKMVGQIVEVYLPKVVEFFIMIAGGNPDKMESNNRLGQQHTDVRGIKLDIDDNFIDPIIPPEDLRPNEGPSNPEREKDI